MNTTPRSALLTASREHFGRVLADTLALAGLRSTALQEAIQRHAARAFDELAGLHTPEEYRRLRSLTASRISLVHPEDMDLTVSFINLNQALSDACERELPRLHLLFMTILGQTSSILDQLPVGPEAVCSALRAFCDEPELGPEGRQILPQKLEPLLIPALRHFYAELTEVLQESGVRAQSLARAMGDAPARGTPSGADGRGYGSGGQVSLGGAQTLDGPPLNRLAGALLRRRAGGAAAPDGAAMGGSGATGGGSLDPALLNALLERVLSWLGEQQRNAATRPYGEGSPLAGLGELQALLPARNNAALDALGLSLDALLTNPTLCPAAKPSLERLRLPLAKLALLDDSLLADPQHAARQLLERMIALASSLPPGAGPEHPVCQAIETTAQAIQRDFQRELGTFAEANRQLDALAGERDAALAARTAALLPLAETEMRREHSRARAARAIRALCAGDIPAPVQTFLEQLWVRVLAAIHQHAGEKADAWFRGLATANKLVDSVQPKPDAPSRQALVSSLPGLIAELRAGLELIGAPEALRERAFQSFVACHAAVINGRQLPPAAAPERLEVAQVARIERPERLPGLHLVRLPPGAEAEEAQPDWVTALEPGHWFELQLAEEPQPRRLIVTWANGAPRALLALEPDSDFALLCPQRWLASQAAEGTAQPLQLDGHLEAAAEQALASYHH